MFIKSRLIVLSLLVAIAVTAATAASSSAFEYQVEKAPVPAGGVELIGADQPGLPFEMEGIIKTKRMSILCAQSLYLTGVESKIEPKGLSKATIKFKSCSAFEVNGTFVPTECKVPDFEYDYKGTLNRQLGEVDLEPAKKGSYAAIEIIKINAAANCALEGSYFLSGVVEVCIFNPSGGEFNKPVYEMRCAAGGSRQELVEGGEAKVRFTEFNKLIKKENWSVT